MAIRDTVAILKNAMIKKTKLKPEHFLLGGIVLSTLLSLATILSFNDWSGSTAPNGRSLMPFMFLVIFITAKYFNVRNKLEVVVLVLFGTLSAYVSWVSITQFVNYMSTGVNSFLVDRYTFLTRLPLFSLVVQSSERGYLIRGAKILFLILICNIMLGVLYLYRVRFIKRR